MEPVGHALRVSLESLARQAMLVLLAHLDRVATPVHKASRVRRDSRDPQELAVSWFTTRTEPPSVLS